MWETNLELSCKAASAFIYFAAVGRSETVAAGQELSVALIKSDAQRLSSAATKGGQLRRMANSCEVTAKKGGGNY